MAATLLLALALSVAATSGVASAACSPRLSSYSSVVSGTPGLVSYWRLGESSGTVACDSTTRNNNGTYLTGTTLGAPGALASDPDTAVALNGSTGQVSIPSASTLNVGDTFTIEAWVKRADSKTGGTEVIASKQEGAWVLMFDESDRLTLRRSIVGNVVKATVATTDTTSWHYVVATKNGPSVHLYIDGVDVTGPVSNQTMANNTRPLVFGQSVGTAFLKGTLDDIALYNTVLTPTQITAHYTAGRGTTETPPPPPAPEPSPSPSTTVAFSSTSPWNVPIPANPTLDPNSASIAGYLGSEMKAYADIYEYGTPVWEATAGDPYNSINCTEPWGTCQLTQQQIPIPATAGTAAGSDGSMVVIDTTSHTGYDFWRASRTSATSWTTAWGTRFDMEGNGTGGGATGAGVPLLAGLPRLSEMTQGRINHAIAFISNNTCASVYRYPASKTDGKSTQSNCVPEGTRIQLDPSINVDTIPGITPGEKTVAHALQTYGGYCKDSGGSRLAFGFEDPVGKTDPYPSLGFSSDYYNMPHIPWNRLRVLHQWDGS